MKNPAWRRRLANHPLRRIVLHPYLTLGCLLLLLLLVFFGTLYEADYGLYEAQRKFFGYSLVWLGNIIPVPGTGLLLWILSLQLILTMVIVMPLSLKKIGLWISHSGLLLLLIGGFITQTQAVESQLTLGEGETGHFSTAYHKWELAVWQAHGDTNQVVAYPDEDLRPGAALNLSPYPATLTVEKYFRNCQAFTDQVTGGVAPYYNASGISLLETRKPEKEVADNAPGLIAVLHVPGQPDHKILCYGLEIKPLILRLNGKTVFFQLRRRHYPLPFALSLNKFERTLHPGTDIAKSYSSYADLQDGLSSRPVKIWMNHPLRYAGYTFYQASFGEDERGMPRSTFAVVTNPGRLLPYISSLTVFGGLLIHFLIRLLGYVKRTATP